MILLRSLLFSIAFYVGTFIVCLLYIPLLIVPRKISRPIYLIWPHYALFCCRWLAGIRYHIEFAEGASLPEGPAIYASKHQSAWETIAFHKIIPDPVYVLKKELTRIPLFGWYLIQLDQIAVDRSAGASALRDMIHQGRKVVSEGHSIVIYPQGTRTCPGDKVPYQPGVFALYKSLEIPVVPISLDSGSFWPKEGIMKYPGCITVRILPPIPPGLDRKEFISRLENMIERECRLLQPEPVDKPVD
jgi:1-acyl-sn-glycerol-3-phosphate acyltransferase